MEDNEEDSMMTRQKDCCPELAMGTRRILDFLTTRKKKGILINL